VKIIAYSLYIIQHLIILFLFYRVICNFFLTFSNSLPGRISPTHVRSLHGKTNRVILDNRTSHKFYSV